MGLIVLAAEATSRSGFSLHLLVRYQELEAV